MRQRFLLFLLLSLGALGARAEPPTVGLVLGGGGARGIAHIGVIRYLEERGIRVKAIAGTSMGAVVGGLYASGLNAEELAEVARTLNWRYAFDDRSRRGQLSFRRKQDDYDYLINARIRFNKGQLQLPLGAIQGQHLNFILHDLVAHVRRTSDFDKLPIPYRAVAADIATGEAVVMQSGDLAVAMRASMSIPGVFAPVDRDGRLLIDGGIARNLPVDVVQAMGVDRVIVVDVGTPLTPREKLDNMLALVDQMTNIMTRRNSQEQIEQMREGDVLIRPALDEADIGSADFDRTEDAMRLGYEAARALEPQLAALSDPSIAGPVAERPPLVLPRIAEVRVESDAAVSNELLRNMISQPVGQKLDRARLEHDIGEIYGLDEFVRVDYQVLKEPAGYVLEVDAKADPAGSSYLKLGMNWEQDSRGTSEFGVRASWRQKAINRLGAEWYTVGQLGGLSLFGTEFHQPLDANRHFFVDTNYQYRQRRLNLAEDGELRARAVIDEHVVELGAGVNISNVAALRAGVFAGTADTDIQIGSPLLSSQSEDDGGWYGEFKFDTLDRTAFPGRGARIVSRFARGAHDWGSSIDYDSWNSSALASVSFGANSFTALARWAQLDIDEAQGGPTEDLLVPTQAFTLGGFLKLSGYTHDSLAGNYLGFASLVYYRRLTGQSLLPFDFPIYAGASLEAGNVWLRKEEAGFDDMLRAGSVFLGVDSPIGPVYFGVGVGEDRQRAVFLQLGQLFD